MHYRAVMRCWLAWIALLVVVGGVLNFAWWMTESASLGGDAVNGYVREGRYYVTSHGTATEVSRAAGEWSRTHGSLSIVAHLLAMAGMAYLMFTVFFPALMPAQTPEAAARLAAVRGSGPKVAGRRCAARLGSLRLSGPLLDVAVHRAGIVMTPLFMSPVALAAHDIEGVRSERIWGSDRLTIDYRVGAYVGPIVLYVPPDDPIALAIQQLATQRLAAHRVPSAAPATVAVSAEPARMGKYPLIMKVWLAGALALSVPFLLIVMEPAST